MKLYKGVFFDRDGTLIFDEGYLADPERITLLSGTIESLRRLQAAGFILFIVTNQSGVARGFFPLADIKLVQMSLLSILKNEGITIRDWRFCPHHPEGVVEEFRMYCNCRKPEPGMILDLSEKYQIDLAASYVIGDKDSDVMAGIYAGCHTILLCGDNIGQTDSTPDSSQIDMFDQLKKIEKPDEYNGIGGFVQRDFKRLDFCCQTITEAVDFILSKG